MAARLQAVWLASPSDSFTRGLPETIADRARRKPSGQVKDVQSIGGGRFERGSYDTRRDPAGAWVRGTEAPNGREALAFIETEKSGDEAGAGGLEYAGNERTGDAQTTARRPRATPRSPS